MGKLGRLVMTEIIISSQSFRSRKLTAEQIERDCPPRLKAKRSPNGFRKLISKPR
jgi:hypothetical protein